LGPARLATASTSTDLSGCERVRAHCPALEGFPVSDLSHVEGAPVEPRAMPPGTPERFTVRATSDSHFAWVRTRLSVERTLMSWVRTAVSLIGFGFAIVQFFDRFQQMPGVSSGRLPGAPLYLGLSLILCGVLGLVVAIWEYHWTIRYLRSGDFALVAGMTKDGIQAPVVAIAGVLIIIGLFAFFAVLLRLM
jgi:putative membrane protein